MSLHLITAATSYPVTLAEMKRALKIDDPDNDTHLESLIAKVVSAIDGRDGYLGRCLLEQTWELRIAGFYETSVCGRFEIPLPPLRSLTSIVYLDSAVAEQAIATSVYDVIDQGFAPAIVQPKVGQTWPTPISGRPDAVRARFVAGYDTGKVPGTILEWIIREVGKRHENRDADIAFDYDALFTGNKVDFVF